jgi:integrase
VLIKAARQNRRGNRDALMVSLAYHHALCVSELIALRWSAIDAASNIMGEASRHARHLSFLDLHQIAEPPSVL